MFTGIIEATGKIVDVKEVNGNMQLYVELSFHDELKMDQSIAHNGVCLTVDEINSGIYRVTAVKETLQKTNLEKLKKGDIVNIERSMKAGDRMDGHIVQGHVDGYIKCIGIKNEEGSHVFTFENKTGEESLLVNKGSVCINGVSLTVCDLTDESFSVAIIPYTYEFTNFHTLKINDDVNIEYDVLGKYISSWLAKREGMR